MMRAWLLSYALRNRLFFCRLFSPAVGQGSSALLTFRTCRAERVKNEVCMSKDRDINSVML